MKNNESLECNISTMQLNQMTANLFYVTVKMSRVWYERVDIYMY